MEKFQDLILKDLPIMPQVATRILQIHEDSFQISFKELESIVSVDPALTARVLKISNSALYARQREITNLQQALTLLGFNTIRSLVILVSASNIFGRSGNRTYEVYLWKHLLITAFCARHLAMKKSMEQKKDDAFIAGLLHDIGRIIMSNSLPEKNNRFLKDLRSGEGPMLALEEKHFSYNHQEAGKYVLEKWNFPDELIDCAEQHHSRNITSKHKSMVIIVGLANLYSKALMGETIGAEETALKEFYGKSLNITPEEDAYYMTDFLKDLEEDELYKTSAVLL